MPKPKMKSPAPDRTQHVVIVDVDGAVDEVLAADLAAAEALAEQVLVAAEQLATVRVPLGAAGAGSFVVVGHLVLDLAKARRTSVHVVSRSLAMASMGIKK